MFPSPNRYFTENSRSVPPVCLQILPHTNTVILLEPYCGTITKPGLPVKSLTVLDASVPTTFSRLIRWLAKSYVIDYCTVFWNSSVLFLRTIYILTNQCEELGLYVMVTLVVGCRLLISFKFHSRENQLFSFMSSAGSRVLRDTFDSIIPPENLRELLKRDLAHSRLKLLRKKGVLTSVHWSRLYPATPTEVSSASFDIPIPSWFCF